MSLSAKRFPVKPAISLEAELRGQGYLLSLGRVESVDGSFRQLSPELAERIVQLRKSLTFASHDDLQNVENWIANLSKGARYMARRIFFGAEPDFRALASDWAAKKDVLNWMRAQDPSWLAKMDLATLDRSGYQDKKGYWVESSWKLQVGKLLHLGIRFAWQAERFCRLYSEVCRAESPWGSCHQPAHGKVKAIALTPNYNRLPLWVKKVMIESPHWIQTQDGRIGNIWRLKDCARAWKHCPELPKRVAERVGKMSVRARFMSRLAWFQAISLQRKETWERFDAGESSDELKKVQMIVRLFWESLDRLLKTPLMDLFKEVKNKFGLGNAYARKFFTPRFLEMWLSLPHKFVDRLDYDLGCMEGIYQFLTDYGPAQEVCEAMYGCSGKATVQAFSKCQNLDAVFWAQNLAHGKPDLIQKYLSLETCIEFEGEACQFLKALGEKPALRMVGRTTYRHRGEDHPVQDYHVKDTGYLWNQIQDKPELGRVRCWLSAHEELGRKFIAEQPDQALRVHPDWERIDGLSAIDGSWEIELPRTTAALKFWGETLHHCVGGYGPKISQGQCIIFAVKQRRLVTHTVEIVPNRYATWKCNQFYGLHNSHAPEELHDDVMAALRDAQLDF